MKRPIVICGDSWGCGEWASPTVPHVLSTQQNNVTHKGLEQYFSDNGHTVTNMSTPGGSNANSILRLTKLLSVRKNNPIILFIITEPTRNFQPHYTNLEQDIVNSDGLFEFRISTLYKDLETLNQLATQHNQTIHLIGALGSVPNIDQFDCLNCLCQSWPELLVGESYPHLDLKQFGIWEPWNFNNTAMEDWLTPKNLQRFEIMFVKKLIQQLDEIDRNRSVFEHTIFLPDKVHPNREGHKILFNHIRKKLEI